MDVPEDGWWCVEEQRAPVERTMEALLCCVRWSPTLQQHISKLSCGVSPPKAITAEPPRGASYEQIERYLLSRARDVVRENEASGSHPDVYAESRSLLATRCVPWLRSAIQELMTRGAVQDEHAAIPNVRPKYRATPEGFAAVCDVLSQRRTHLKTSGGGAAAPPRGFASLGAKGARGRRAAMAKRSKRRVTAGKRRGT